MAFAHSDPGWQPPTPARLKSTVAQGVLVGTYGLRFSKADQKDVQGEYFDYSATSFGPNLGSPIPVMLNHGLPTGGLTDFRDEIFGPASLERDTVGLWATTVLDPADPLQAGLLELVEAGALRWSTGSAAHVVRKTAEGLIQYWPIIEISLTSTPAEFRLPKIRVL